MEMDNNEPLPGPEESVNNVDDDVVGWTSSGSQYGTQAETA